MGRHHPVHCTKVSFDKALRRTKVLFNEAVCPTKNEDGRSSLVPSAHSGFVSVAKNDSLAVRRTEE